MVAFEKMYGDTKTDANGEFVFFNLSPRHDYALRVIHPGYYRWEAAEYQIQAGYDATLTGRLWSGRALSYRGQHSKLPQDRD